jgi:hypothetical protein
MSNVKDDKSKRKKLTCHHVSKTVVLPERLLLVKSLPLYNVILVPELLIMTLCGMFSIERRTFVTEIHFLLYLSCYQIQIE